VSQYPPTPKRRRSYAKLLEASAFWAIFAAVIGWLVYKEISKNTIEIEQAKAGRKLVIESKELHGIAERSALVCQGLTVGSVTEIEAIHSGENSENLSISIHARLDERYSDWIFLNEANVDKGDLMSGLTGTRVALVFAGLIPEKETKADFSKAETQRITLNAPEDTGARMKALLTEVEDITGALTKEVSPPEDWPEGEKATRIDVLTANFYAASEAINSAAQKLEYQMDEKSDESLMAGMHDILHDIDKELKSFTENSNQLITDAQETVTSIDKRLDDTLGASPAERAQLRKESAEVLTSLDALIDRLDDLASRTGDTFLGRTLIRKPSDDKSGKAPAEKKFIRRAGPGR
tara:strand:+ start:1147 stop:2199 length:1053 start_codon:yes stop_codon:yes gene_type:complete